MAFAMKMLTCINLEELWNMCNPKVVDQVSKTKADHASNSVVEDVLNMNHEDIEPVQLSSSNSSSSSSSEAESSRKEKSVSFGRVASSHGNLVE